MEICRNNGARWDNTSDNLNLCSFKMTAIIMSFYTATIKIPSAIKGKDKEAPEGDSFFSF